jgi:hypothetical protein
MSGYSTNGSDFHCSFGVLSGGTQCVADSCLVTAPVNGKLGASCDDGEIISGAMCTMMCNAGFVLVGNISLNCSHGLLSGEQTCMLLQPMKSSDALSVGGVVGLSVAGAVLFLGLSAAAVFLCTRRCSNLKALNSESNVTSFETPSEMMKGQSAMQPIQLRVVSM